MYPQGPTRLSLTGAIALALAAAVLTAPTFARAEDDNVPIDTKIVRSIMKGLGLKRPGEAEIKYEERAPLVIPPNSELPPPQAAGAAIANNPAWPKDPDIARAKLLRAQEANRDDADVDRDHYRLRPDQLGPGAANQRTAARRTGTATDASNNVDNTEHYRMTPSELGVHGGGLFSWNNMFGAKDEEASAKFTGEPKRTTLTDPPPGYQTPSPDQPYGLGKASTAPKATNSYATHGEMGADSR